MGVWPCGAQVWITLGINWKPDSSANTMWAPNRAAFFLSAASLFVSSVQSLFHPAPRPAVLASGDSISNCASNGRHGRRDAELHTYAGSVRQCERWSTDWFDSRAPEVLAKANDQAFRRTWLSFKGRPEEYRTRKAFSPPLRPHPQALRRSPTRPGVALASYPTTACDEPRGERGI